MQNTFSKTLTSTLDFCGKKPNEVAYIGRVDSAYLRKLLQGEKRNPSPETLRKIWIGCVFDPRILDKHPDLIHGLANLAEAAVLSAGNLSSAEGAN